MNKFSIAAVASVLALGVAAPAFAQSGPSEVAPFTGPRVEVLAGYDHLGGDGGRNGLVYGGALGYDAQVGGVVLGIDGEITGATTRGVDTSVVVPGDRFRVKAGRDLYVGGRLGYVISPQALIYAKAGYTNARVNERYTSTTLNLNDHDDLSGYRLGAGLEYKLTGNAYIKAEYRYSHYGKLDNVDVNLNRHQVLGGVGFRF